MRVAIHGLSRPLADAVAQAFLHQGYELGEAAEVVIVGADPATGADLLELPQAEWDGAIVSARAAFFALQGAARSMVERGAAGCLVGVVPVHAVRTSRGCGTAAVVGSFLTTAAQVAAVELGAHGIRVNVLAVGPLEGDAAARTAEGVPLGRLTRPGDVAAACTMLAEPEAAFISGAVIPVDGGYAVTKTGGGSPFARG